MNKFTKISAAALFSLFLTACDKPAEKKAEAPAQNTETTQTTAVESPNTETQAPLSAEEIQGAEDFKKLVAWNSDQEKEIAAEQSTLQQMLATQDKAQIEEAFRKFTLKVGNVIRSLEAVEIKNADVQKLKDKLKESLSLSSEVLSGSLSAMHSGEASAELQAELQAKAQQLIQIGTELETLQSELRQKFIK